MPDVDLNHLDHLGETIDSLDYLLDVALDVLELHRSLPEHIRNTIDLHADFFEEIRVFTLPSAMLSEQTQLRVIEVLRAARNACCEKYGQTPQ